MCCATFPLLGEWYPLILHLISSVKKLGKNFENCSGVLL